VQAKDFEAAYRATTYRVTDPPLALRIGHRHPQADQILLKHQANSWAFLTAWNPGSIELCREANAALNEALKQKLEEHIYFEALGEPENSDWTAEASVWILGMSREAAEEIARDFGQNAFVYGDAGEAAELVFCPRA